MEAIPKQTHVVPLCVGMLALSATQQGATFGAAEGLARGARLHCQRHNHAGDPFCTASITLAHAAARSFHIAMLAFSFR